MSTAAQVIYRPVIPEFAPGAKPCSHDHKLSIGTRIERGKGLVDCMFCLRCGAVVANTAFSCWLDAWQAAWDEFGWNREIGMRLQEFAEIVREETALPTDQRS